MIIKYYSLIRDNKIHYSLIRDNKIHCSLIRGYKKDYNITYDNKTIKVLCFV